MNLDSLNKWLMLAANLGVLAGIIFLAIEISQNSEYLRADSSYRLLENRSRMRVEAFINPEFAEFYYRAENHGELSELENYRITKNIELTFLRWQWEYGQYIDGNFAEGELPIEAWEAAMEGKVGFFQGYKEVWNYFSFQLRPDFVEFMNTEVIKENNY